MRFTTIIFSFFLSLCLQAQNRTSTTRRNNNLTADTLSKHQIHVFSRILDNMVFVDCGSYEMGVFQDRHQIADDNMPRHRVWIDPFFIGRFEVTQEEWKAVMETNPSSFKGDDLPVENVSWNDCQIFIQKLNDLTGMDFRMPTEAEWEFAARGGKYETGNSFSGSDYARSVAWFSKNCKATTHPVGQKRPNELGIYDMSGNVAEWCADFYDRHYYSVSPYENPKGPQTGINKVMRGGGWPMDSDYMKVWVRNVSHPDESNNAVGLRLAM